MKEIEASLIITGPIPEAHAYQIHCLLRPKMYQELMLLLINEDGELGYGATYADNGPVVLGAQIHFRVSDLELAVETVSRLYTEFGLHWSARVSVYGPDREFVADYPLLPPAEQATPNH